jgi:CheY-like chemotaxis protein
MQFYKSKYCIKILQDKLKNHQLTISDFQMPDTNGFELIEELMK